MSGGCWLGSVGKWFEDVVCRYVSYFELMVFNFHMFSMAISSFCFWSFHSFFNKAMSIGSRATPTYLSCLQQGHLRNCDLIACILDWMDGMVVRYSNWIRMSLRRVDYYMLRSVPWFWVVDSFICKSLYLHSHLHNWRTICHSLCTHLGFSTFLRSSWEVPHRLVTYFIQVNYRTRWYRLHTMMSIWKLGS